MGHSDCLEHLIECGAHINAQDKVGVCDWKSSVSACSCVGLIAVTACSSTGRGHSTPRGCALRAPQSNEAPAALWSQAGHEECGECQPGKAGAEVSLALGGGGGGETDPVSLFTGLPDTSAAGSRLAAGHPGSPPGPRGAPPHPVLMTGTRGSLTVTIPHPPTTPVPISLWLCFLGPEAAGRAGLLGFSEKHCSLPRLEQRTTGQQETKASR